MMPMTSEAHAATKPAAGVITTRPATRPVQAPTSVACPVTILSTTIHESMAAAEAATVFTSAMPATPSSMASAEPALKPSQPNHRRPAPSATKGTLCAR